MNFQKVQRKNRKAIYSGHFRTRKAISPVLATVILIAITLIAAIAIAGFVFGLFGTFTSGQNLQLVGQNCFKTNSSCTLSLTNTGGASASITGCTIYGQNGVVAAVAPGTLAIAAGTTSGAPAKVTCTQTAAQITAHPITSGAATTGTLVVASGSPLTFSAIAQ